MRKEMNSKSKRKWVAGGLAAFASVALLTTGFATWVVGTNNLVVNNDTAVNVATAQNASIELSMEISEANRKIKFAETSAYVPENTDFVRVDSEEGANGDLTLDFESIKVTYGVNSGFIPSEYKLTFTVEKIVNASSEDVSGSANTISTLGTFGRTNGTPYSYFEAPAAIDLDSNNGTPSTVGSVSTYTFKPSACNVAFRWGSAWGTKSPAKFYNDYFKAPEHVAEKTAANAEIVRSELAAMHAALNGATITLKAELVKTGAGGAGA